jgi:hypothetical protein
VEGGRVRCRWFCLSRFDDPPGSRPDSRVLTNAPATWQDWVCLHSSSTSSIPNMLSTNSRSVSST